MIELYKMNNLLDFQVQLCIYIQAKMMKTLVNHYMVDQRLNLKVEIRVNILDLLKKFISADFSEIQKVGTYTRRFDITNIMVRL